MNIFKWQSSWNMHTKQSWSRRIVRGHLYEPNYVHILYSQIDKSYIVIWQGDELSEYEAMYSSYYYDKCSKLKPLIKNVNNFIDKLQKLKSFT